MNREQLSNLTAEDAAIARRACRLGRGESLNAMRDDDEADAQTMDAIHVADERTWRVFGAQRMRPAERVRAYGDEGLRMEHFMDDAYVARRGVDHS